MHKLVSPRRTLHRHCERIIKCTSAWRANLKLGVVSQAVQQICATSEDKKKRECLPLRKRQFKGACSCKRWREPSADMRPGNRDKAPWEDRSCEWIRGGVTHLFFTEVLIMLIVTSNYFHIRCNFSCKTRQSYYLGGEFKRRSSDEASLKNNCGMLQVQCRSGDEWSISGMRQTMNTTYLSEKHAYIRLLCGYVSAAHVYWFHADPSN